MLRRAEWIKSQVAPTRQALQAGDGCHWDEGKSLGDYLDNKMTPHEAATAITQPVLRENDPARSLYRLMGLLCEAMVDLSDDRYRLLDLLAAIQSLPPSGKIDWHQLPNFGYMWADLYGLHLHGPDDWEKTQEPLSDTRRAELCQYMQNVGTAEAELYLRGLGSVTSHWGYGTLNMIQWRRPGLVIFISAAHAWLLIAGWKLKRDLKPDEVAKYGKQGGVEGTMAEHWKAWKAAFLQISDEGNLPAEARKLAKECHHLM